MLAVVFKMTLDGLSILQGFLQQCSENSCAVYMLMVRIIN